MPPKFLQEPQDVVTVEGQDILVPCVVEGFPDPVVKWRREPGSRQSESASAGSDPGDAFLAGMAVNQQFPNGSLLLTLATKAMEGAYTCTATNGVKYDIRKTINVTVNGEFKVFLRAKSRFDHVLHIIPLIHFVVLPLCLTV